MILAIIAVITVPIILNVIDNAKKGSVIDSAYGYKDAVQKYYVQKLYEDQNFKFEDGKYLVSRLKTMGVNVNGTEPSEGYVEISENKVTNYSIKLKDYTVTYNYDTDKISAIKNGEIIGGPRILPSEIGAEVKDFGGYDWHVISSDETTITLLMDAGENGSYKLPDDTKGNLKRYASSAKPASGSEPAIPSIKIGSQMKHCLKISNTNETNCTPIVEISNASTSYYYYTYSWEKSLINEYLNRNSVTGDFLYDLKNQISNRIIPIKVCNDPSISKKNENDYSYGGYLMSEIQEENCTSSSEYSVRLISPAEYQTLKTNLISGDTSWLYSNKFIWWTMGSCYDTYSSSVIASTAVGTSGNLFNEGSGDATFVIRPVITIYK